MLSDSFLEKFSPNTLGCCQTSRRHVVSPCVHITHSLTWKDCDPTAPGTSTHTHNASRTTTVINIHLASSKTTMHRHSLRNRHASFGRLRVAHKRQSWHGRRTPHVARPLVGSGRESDRQEICSLGWCCFIFQCWVVALSPSLLLGVRFSFPVLWSFGWCSRFRKLHSDNPTSSFWVVLPSFLLWWCCVPRLPSGT